MTWKNDNSDRLYVVKREFAEEYHTGSYSSATPKLYKIGYAKSACREMNGLYERSWTVKWDDTLLTKAEWVDKNTHPHRSWSDDYITEQYNYYVEDHAKGPWVVAEVQFTASKVDIS